jgi:hypothetical protein
MWADATGVPGARWRKSTRSNGGGAQCVEVTYLPRGGAVRDSKNPTGPALSVDLSGLVRAVRDCRFER